MPLPKTHKVYIVPNKPKVVTGGSPLGPVYAEQDNPTYPLKVVCSGCQYEALARTEEMANYFAHGHAGYAKVMGQSAEVVKEAPSPAEGAADTPFNPGGRAKEVYGGAREVKPEIKG